jgi:hypothetical protein
MYKPYDADRPWIGAPVGSFPRNQTPQRVYDMVGYFLGQWCSDVYEPVANDQVSPSGVLRVVRGVGQKNTNLAQIWPNRGVWERFYNLLGETSIQQYHDGRSWTRTGLPESGYALIRLALDSSDN